MALTIKKYFTRCFIFILWALFTLPLFGQKYNFQHYDIDKGLLQSQVTAITKDNLNQIWLANLGGVNCFDGKQFTAFTIDNGLKNYFNLSITTDNKGRVWCGNAKGLTCFDSNGLVSYPLTGNANLRPARRVICDKNDNVWALCSQSLFKLVNGKVVIQKLTDSTDRVSDIEKDEQGNLYAAIANKGIYCLINNSWQPIAPLTEFKNIGYIMQFAFVPGHAGQVYMITANRLILLKDKVTSLVDDNLISNLHTSINCMAIDHNMGIWLGIDKGACLLANHTLKHFDGSNGFTNTRSFCIYVDDDNHIWFGTDGTGLYKYQPGDYVVYDKSQGLTNDLAMQMVKNRRGEMYIATYGGGLKSCVNNKITDIAGLPPFFTDARVNCLFVDSQDDLWIGTDDYGLWKMTKGRIVRIAKISSCTFITEDRNHVIWLTTNFGCYYVKNNKTVPIGNLNYQCTALLEMGNDSLLVGTVNGLVLVKNKTVIEKSTQFRGISINCLQNFYSNILIGTSEHGLLLWNTRINGIKKLPTRSLDSSNTVSSMLLIDKQLWLGTSRGVSRYSIGNENDPVLKRMPLTSDLYECNQNSILLNDDKVWIGTTHGIIIFDKQVKKAPPLSLHLAIQKVTVITPGVKHVVIYKNGYKIPYKLELPSNESRISLRFQAIEFGNNQTAYYQYQLEGLDKDFNSPVPDNTVEYPQLPPGNYTFKVKAIIDGTGSDTATFPFTVVPTIYQTSTFKFLVLLLLLSAIVAIYIYKIYSHRKKLNYINQLKLHEQDLVRRQTAEDFHDDFGNKLTRINMLSELLARNFKQHNETERKLVEQIQLSASEMYAGTKDILWALNPDNDNLAEVVDVIKTFAENLFLSTDIKLNFNTPADESKFKEINLPLGHSRNIILIFKELFTNILKHSKAKIVTFSVDTASDGYIEFDVTDNGQGFDPSHAAAGNGVKNMKNRAKKLNASLTITSENNAGVTSTLLLPVP